MWKPGTNGVSGSRTCHACPTNSRKLLAASSRSSFTRLIGFVNQDCKLLEFIIGQLLHFRCRPEGNRATIGTTHFICNDVLVAEQVLGKEDHSGDVPRSGQLE